VWLAAAKHVLANESTGTEMAGPLFVLVNTSFPKSPISMAALSKSVREQFCNVPSTEAASIVSDLARLNSNAVSVREAFAGLTQFRITEERPSKGDYLGISNVLFSADRHTAYLNLDIGGVSGSIVRMKRENGEWGKLEECAQWASY
jgi:hypothetical protein